MTAGGDGTARTAAVLAPSVNGFGWRRHAADAGLHTVMRVALGVTVLILVVLITVLSRSAGAVSGDPFQPGACIAGRIGAATLSSANCTAAHDARIDSLVTGAGRCPAGDDVFVAPRHPALCLDYSDHLP